MELPEPLIQRKLEFQEALLGWYAANRRDFPWRNTVNSFEILIAEKLLQQTRASGIVVQVYIELLAKYPTPAVLMHADVEELRKIIRPLGLVFRAEEIVQMASQIVLSYESRIPANLEGLLNLKGVGDYVARAVLSFAFDHQVPIVDTNIARFLYRICDEEKPLPNNPSRNGHLRCLAAQLLPENKAKDFNFAVLDLCAMICTSQNPKCNMCPLFDFCGRNAA